MKKIILVLVLILVTTGVFSLEEEIPSYEKSGFGFEVGIGSTFVGVGVNAVYFLQSKGFAWTPFLGVGYYPSISIMGIETEGLFGWVSGSRLCFGGAHRFVIEASYGVVGVEAVKTSTAQAQKELLGMASCIGYQYINPEGLYFTITAGAVITETSFGVEMIAPTMNISLGLK